MKATKPSYPLSTDTLQEFPPYLFSYSFEIILCCGQNFGVEAVSGNGIYYTVGKLIYFNANMIIALLKYTCDMKMKKSFWKRKLV
jgi:hypothetical protein